VASSLFRLLVDYVAQISDWGSIQRVEGISVILFERLIRYLIFTSAPPRKGFRKINGGKLDSISSADIKKKKLNGHVNKDKNENE
jgi:hypothetical protein